MSGPFRVRTLASSSPGVSSYPTALALNREPQDIRVGQLAARKLAPHDAATQHQRAVTERADLLGLGAGDDHAHAFGGQLADHVVHVSLRPDVQTARRL